MNTIKMFAAAMLATVSIGFFPTRAEYSADNPEAYLGRFVGDGQCVDFVQKAANVPFIIQWRPGAWVRGNLEITRGTAIATFDEDGSYKSSKTGNHAAIYIGQDENGIWVYDQWSNPRKQQPVHKRLIRFGNDRNRESGSMSNNGDWYRVIERRW